MTGLRERFTVRGVDADTPLRVAAPAILAAKAAPLFELEARACTGQDAEAVHDMRVASRRTREALRLFEGAYPRHGMRRWARRMRDITRGLGQVRDADVYRIHLISLVDGATPSERTALAYLIGREDGAREARVAAMHACVIGLDLGARRSAWETFAQRPAGADLSEPLGSFSRAAIAPRVDAVYAHLPEALDEMASAAQHAMRIDMKRLRYAVETFAPAFGPAFDDRYPVLKEFQDVLGELHDRDVFTDHVAAALAAGAPPGVSDAGLRRILVDLAAERHELFVRFVELVAAWPAETMLLRLVGALDPVAPGGEAIA